MTADGVRAPSLGESQPRVGISADDLAAIYLLASVRGFDAELFKLLHLAGANPSEVLIRPGLIPISGKSGTILRREIARKTDESYAHCLERARRQIEAALNSGSAILSYRHPHYPSTLLASSYPVPVLYAAGSLALLSDAKAVACVGSRQIRHPYAELHAEVARTAAALGFTFVAGFMIGADAIGHKAVRECGGRAICVVQSGLDRPYPPENRTLWNALSTYAGAVMISEVPFGTTATTLTLRRRNHLIASISRGVLVSQSSRKDAAMNSFRFALEQRKPIATFEPDDRDDTAGNRLIRSNEKAQATVFPAHRAALLEVGQWLQALS
jgi:predicted Rossmann fold nucleotide-binding protein DprA/Smf involved in DNA uptake